MEICAFLDNNLLGSQDRPCLAAFFDEGQTGTLPH